MCGIAGLMTRQGDIPEAGVVQRMADAQAHRGPDGQGDYRRDNLALAHQRLAIIDLTTGDQPLFGPQGLTLIANGEIYNDPDLRAQLTRYPFRTGSDCESPLALYPNRGAAFPAALRGMYAIALHDPIAGRLILSRDPFGIKPLYYAECPAGLLFASEPQAILASGWIGRHLDPLARDELLQLQFTTGANTIFQGIRRLLPGETLVIADGRLQERYRLEALPRQAPNRRRSDAETLAELDRVLHDSVRAHQRADVPFGMFLSGGIDSASLLSLMAELNERPVQAFTATFPETNARDESPLAQRLAAKLGADHHEVAVTSADFWDTLPAIAAALDDPAADYAIVPTYLLAKAARRSVKVILSGEGGDELFGGYGRYRSANRPWPFRRAMRRQGLLSGLDLLRDNSLDWRAGYHATEQATRRAWPQSRLQAAQALDCADWLPNDLLIKLDRCLMAHGIEGRVPFLDPAVAAFATSLRDDQKQRDGRGKWLLRQWLAQRLPEADPFSRKRGFTVPVTAWLAQRPTLGAVLARRPAIQEVCRPGRVEALFQAIAAGDKKAGQAGWTLLFYALWHRCHIEGLAPTGGVFDLLADMSD